MAQFVSEYKGFSIYYTHISFNCPRLKLYGYKSETSVKRKITAQLKKDLEREAKKALTSIK